MKTLTNIKKSKNQTINIDNILLMMLKHLNYLVKELLLERFNLNRPACENI